MVQHGRFAERDSMGARSVMEWPTLVPAAQVSKAGKGRQSRGAAGDYSLPRKRRARTPPAAEERDSDKRTMAVDDLAMSGAVNKDRHQEKFSLEVPPPGRARKLDAD